MLVTKTSPQCLGNYRNYHRSTSLHHTRFRVSLVRRRAQPNIQIRKFLCLWHKDNIKKIKNRTERGFKSKNKMSLPRLPTLTTQGAAFITTTTDAGLPALTSTTSSSRALPHLTSTLTSSSLASSTSSSTTTSSSFTAPPISVPESTSNPYISRSISPSGTVFICFGAILGAILICTILAYAFNSWRASRIVLTKEHDYDPESKNYNYIPELPLLRSQLSNNAQAPDDIFTQIRQTSPYRGPLLNTLRPTDVTKMFISPTEEVLNVKRNSQFYDPDNWRKSLDLETTLGQYHNRNESTFSDKYNRQRPVSPPPLNSRNSSYEPVERKERGRKGHKVVPSMVLDDLLKD